MKQFWEERYGKEEFAYGEEPNQFLKEQLANVEPGTILFPLKVKEEMPFLRLN